VTAPAFCDDEALVQQWVNASAIAGSQGGVVVKGAHLQKLRTGASGSFIVLSSLGGDDGDGEPNLHYARVSAGVYGASKADAKTAALAYANLLRTVAAPVALTGARLYAVESIDGPTWVPDGPEPRYAVDATFVFQPA
jgi:hypothetical protein